MSKIAKAKVKRYFAVEADASARKELDKYLETLANPPRSFSKGEIVTGKVVGVGIGELLVDVGGRAEGVVAGKELRLEGDKTVQVLGDDVLVYVIKGENDKGQIELSIRRTGSARKWYDLKIAKDTDLTVTVKAIEANTGGVIVDVGGGLRGFIPTSQLDSGRIYLGAAYSDKAQATQELQNRLADLIGKELEVKIIEIDREKNRVIFSEKLVHSSANAELRKETLSKAQVGTNLEAEVTGIAPFGLFVSAQGLEGLVHLSEISWDKVTNPSDFYKVGDKVNVKIIGIQDEGKRVAYSIKRLLPDPWDDLVKGFEVGQIVEGKVTKVADYGAFVRIGDGLNGLIHISEMSDKLVKDPNDIVKYGDDIKVMIISISREDRHLGLSIKRIAKGEKPTAKVESEEEGQMAPELASLKNILGDDSDEK